jgi:hypothetical protein
MVFEIACMRNYLFLEVVSNAKEKKYVVKLDDAECQQLEELLRGGQHLARKLTRARILLKADAGYLVELS